MSTPPVPSSGACMGFLDDLPSRYFSGLNLLDFRGRATLCTPPKSAFLHSEMLHSITQFSNLWWTGKVENCSYLLSFCGSDLLSLTHQCGGSSAAKGFNYNPKSLPLVPPPQCFDLKTLMFFLDYCCQTPPPLALLISSAWEKQKKGGKGESRQGALNGFTKLTVVHVIREFLLISSLRILQAPDCLCGGWKRGGNQGWKETKFELIGIPRGWRKSFVVGSAGLCPSLTSAWVPPAAAAATLEAWLLPLLLLLLLLSDSFTREDLRSARSPSVKTLAWLFSSCSPSSWKAIISSLAPKSSPPPLLSWGIFFPEERARASERTSRTRTGWRGGRAGIWKGGGQAGALAVCFRTSRPPACLWCGARTAQEPLCTQRGAKGARREPGRGSPLPPSRPSPPSPRKVWLSSSQSCLGEKRQRRRVLLGKAPSERTPVSARARQSTREPQPKAFDIKAAVGWLTAAGRGWKTLFPCNALLP